MIANRRILVKCDKCGFEFYSRLWDKGDIHAGCGGEFKPVEYKGGMHNE